jgi:hypothetical protein
MEIPPAGDTGILASGKESRCQESRVKMSESIKPNLSLRAKRGNLIALHYRYA